METEGKIPDELADNPEFEFKYDVPSLFDLFDEINITAFSRKLGINPSLMRQYKNGLAFASKKQIDKIKSGFKELGNQLIAAGN